MKKEITTCEIAHRVYDKLFDMIGFSKHHVDLEHGIEILNQGICRDNIEIKISDAKGLVRTFHLTVYEVD